MKVNEIIKQGELKKSKKEASKELLSILGINPRMKTEELTKKEIIAIKQRVKNIKQENEYFKERYKQ